MKKTTIIALLATFVFNGVKAQESAIKASIDYLDKNFKTYNNLQKEIWSNSELGYQEVKSSKALKDHLKANGFTIQEGIAGEPTAFIATYGSGKPIIGITAEFDALPGLSQDSVPYRKILKENGPGHGCGHNLFGVASSAAGVAISRWLKATNHEGTIRIYGSPAEEGGSGKTYIVRDGYYKDVDIVLDWHPGGDNAVRTEPGLAKVGIEYRFTGHSAHAAGNPWKGRSALDAVEILDVSTNFMREHIKPHNRIHYVIPNGGGAPNVVPSYAVVEYYMRSPNVKELKEIVNWIDSAAQGAALATQTHVEKYFVAGQYQFLINETIAKLLQKNLEKVGGVTWNEREFEFARRLNEHNVNPDSILNQIVKVKPLGKIKKESEGGGSTDVADISWNVPTASFGTVTTVPGNPGHSWENAATVGTTIGTKGLINAAKVFTYSAIDLFLNPEIVQAAKDEFVKARPADFNYEPLAGDLPPRLDYRKGRN